jgi:hypothetical protein
MTNTLVAVRVIYNGALCYELGYAPGESVRNVRSVLLNRHILTSFKMRSEIKEELDENDTLDVGIEYEITCEYGKSPCTDSQTVSVCSALTQSYFPTLHRHGRRAWSLPTSSRIHSLVALAKDKRTCNCGVRRGRDGGNRDR